LQTNDVVDRIPINAFRHGRFLITANQSEGNISEHKYKGGNGACGQVPGWSATG
jgi:hypothetical protein